MREVGFTPFAIGPYRCEERLRAGGIGDLYLATHLPTGSHRGLWQLPSEVLDDAEAAAQLLRVQLRVQTLSHPNIQIVHDVIRKEVEIYVALEHHPGVTLLQVLRKLREVGAFAPAVAGFVVWQVCLALDHVHHLKHDGRPAPLIHGALWPQSVLCSFKGEVRLGGFGTWVIPRTESEEVSIRTQFSYRSPEHVSGEPLSRSSDLFCVGVLLAEMLLARPLLLGETLMETVERVERAEIPDLGRIPPLLQKVIRRCLAPKPSDRYADIAAFISELGVVVHGMGDRSVRQDLVTFLNAHFQESARASARPAPLPGAEEDETTSISPRDLADALRELSRERTEPGRLPKRLPEKVADLQPIETDTDEAEPTRVDRNFVPEPLAAVNSGEIDADEGPTALSAPPQITVTWEEAPHGGERVTNRLLSTDPGSPALFPPEDDERTVTGETSPEVLSSLRKDGTGALSSPHLPAAPFDAGFADDETTTQGVRGSVSVSDEEPTENKRPSVDQTTNPSPGGRLASTLVEDPTRDSVVDELPTSRMSPVLVEELSGNASSQSTEEVPTQNAKPAAVRAASPRLDPRRNPAERTPVVPVDSRMEGLRERAFSGPTGPVQPLASPRRDATGHAPAGTASIAARRDPTGRVPPIRAEGAPAAPPRRDPTGRAPAIRAEGARRRDPTGRPSLRAGDPEAPRSPTPPRGPRPASSPSPRGTVGARREPTGRLPAIPPAPKPGPPSPPPDHGAYQRPNLVPPPQHEKPAPAADRGVGGLPTLEAHGDFFPGPPPSSAPPRASAIAPTEFPHADEVGSEASQEATSAVDPGLFFEGPNVSDAEAPRSAPAGPESFDPDAFSAAYYSSYGASQSMRGKGFRFTLAHGMLLIAILVFLVAVALLVRRVVIQRRGRPPPAKVARAPDARVPASSPIPSGKPDLGSGSRKPDLRSGSRKPDPTRLPPSGLPAGKLRIGIDPPPARGAGRAVVYLDRKRAGIAPLTMAAAVGATVDLLVEAPGFALHQAQLVMPPDRGLEVRVQLKPGKYPRAMKRNGTLYLLCKKKDGRRIFVDGEDTGIACTTRHYFRLAGGKHRVQLYSIAKDKRILYQAKVKARRRTTVYITK